MTDRGAGASEKRERLLANSGKRVFNGDINPALSTVDPENCIILNIVQHFFFGQLLGTCSFFSPFW